MQNGSGQQRAEGRGTDEAPPPPSLADAERALEAIDACLLGLLPTASASGGGARTGPAWPTPEQAAQRAEALVDASATISRALRAFGAARPSTRPQSEAALLRRAVRGLEAESANAAALLARAKQGVARWRAGAEAAKASIEQRLALPPPEGVEAAAR